MKQYTFGIMIYGKKYIKIGDYIDIIFSEDGEHIDGTLEEIKIEDNEIVVDSVVYSLDEIIDIVVKEVKA